MPGIGQPADVYTAREIARAAGVPVRLVRARMAAGTLATIDGTFVGEREAVQCVRALTGGAPSAAAAASPLLAPARNARRRTGLPLVLSSALHVAALLVFVTMSSLGLLRRGNESDLAKKPEPARMVFLVQPGPGGGGGGGGLRQPTPPTPVRIARPKPRPASRPIPIRRPPLVTTRARVTPPPPQRPVRPVTRETTRIEWPKPAPAQPAVVAPVVSDPADPADAVGTLDATDAPEPSAGNGSGGGGGSGAGTGLGEGTGAGIGPGSGGGTGGGPYRPGSGIDPPSLLREVKPLYTDQARRQGVEGDVVLEIVVQRDGTVGDVKILRRLGAGLDQKAIDAVRQWRFAPARRLGAPIDVVVDVAVEFKLR